MEAGVDGGSGNDIFAAAIDANDGMVPGASTAAAQLMTTTANTAATIGRRRHCRQCHCVILHPSLRCLRQQQPPSKKTTITTAAIDRWFHQ
jgi:hypothetical protein